MDTKKKTFAIQILRRGTYKHYGRWIGEKRSRLGHGTYFCESCGLICKKKDTQLDHKLPAVDPVRGWQGFDEFIDRLYCEPENYQRLCIPCHQSKTSDEGVVRKDSKKNKKA